MSPGLFQCLTEERSIFRIFDSSKTLGDFEAFHSPRREAVAHWNLAYPLKREKSRPTPNETAALLDYYLMQGLQGHLATDESRWKDAATEECEYFKLTDPPRAVAAHAEGYRHRSEDLKLFASVIQQCFILSDSSKDAFVAKMEKLREHEGSRFYVIESKDGRVVGCANTIRTESGADFLVNVGALPDFNDISFFNAIVGYVASRATRPLYTYHRSPVMRGHVLRSAGFSPLGVMYCVPLDALMNERK